MVCGGLCKPRPTFVDNGFCPEARPDAQLDRKKSLQNIALIAVEQTFASQAPYELANSNGSNPGSFLAQRYEAGTGKD